MTPSYGFHKHFSQTQAIILIVNHTPIICPLWLGSQSFYPFLIFISFNAPLQLQINHDVVFYIQILIIIMNNLVYKCMFHIYLGHFQSCIFIAHIKIVFLKLSHELTIALSCKSKILHTVHQWPKKIVKLLSIVTFI